MDNLANLIRARLSQGSPAAAAFAPVGIEAAAYRPPTSGRMTYSKMPAHVAFTPEEEAANLAWERGDTNRGELERALRMERDPEALALLAQEYGDLFGEFDPTGTGYDYASAVRAGLRPDSTGHWPSRVPDTGMILKGMKHPTYGLSMEAEREAGMTPQRDIEDGRVYSNRRPELETAAMERPLMKQAPRTGWGYDVTKPGGAYGDKNPVIESMKDDKLFQAISKMLGDYLNRPSGPLVPMTPAGVPAGYGR